MNNLLFKSVKGNQVNIPKLYQGAIQSGNANDPKNIGRITRKSSLFFLTTTKKQFFGITLKNHGINLFGEMV